MEIARHDDQYLPPKQPKNNHDRAKEVEEAARAAHAGLSPVPSRTIAAQPARRCGTFGKLSWGNNNNDSTYVLQPRTPYPDPHLLCALNLHKKISASSDTDMEALISTGPAGTGPPFPGPGGIDRHKEMVGFAFHMMTVGHLPYARQVALAQGSYVFRADSAQRFSPGDRESHV